MSVPVLIGFAGVLVAAVATGMLAGRCVRQPRTGFLAWTAATLALTVALAAQSMGFASGFGPATFRAVQLSALVLAPLWLTWGLAELSWPNEAARFGARLACCALTVVAGVILATDPLSGQPFSKAWPPSSQHYQPIAHSALDVVQAIAVILAAISTVLAAARARNDRQARGLSAGAALIGLAVLITAGLRFSLPAGPAYPLLSMIAAALVWFGVTRIDARPARAGRRRPAGEQATGTRAAGQDDPGRWEVPAPPEPAPVEPAGPRPDPGRPAAPHVQPARPPGAARTVTTATGYGTPPGAQGGPAGSPAASPARPYGRILIFTLLEDRVADFDRLAEQTAEEVRTREPGTLVHVIHLVPNAPMQRIFYEIYRDRAAFDHHERQPYMQRFVTGRRAFVLATNVIELRLKYAKVAPLPGPPSPGPVPPSGQAPPPGQVPPSGQAPSQDGPPAQLPPVPPSRIPRARPLEPLPPGPGRRLPSAGRSRGGI